MSGPKVATVGGLTGLALVVGSVFLSRMIEEGVWLGMDPLIAWTLSISWIVLGAATVAVYMRIAR